MTPLQELLLGHRSVLRVDPEGGFSLDGPPPTLLVPGSFNPLHEGHLGMARAAQRRIGGSFEFEMSIVNVEKAPLDEGEITRRLQQFVHLAPAWLTRAPTFVEKSQLFGAVKFVVGADTAARIVQPRFYGDEARLHHALQELRDRCCRFLVAGRLIAGSFVTLEQLEIPEAFLDLFEAIAETEFRADVSSTSLRQNQRSG